MKLLIDTAFISSEWESCDIGSLKIYARGFFFFQNEYYHEKKAINFLAQCFEDGCREIKKASSFLQKDLKDTLDSLNGSWAFVVIRNETQEVCLAVDRFRSLPLFYTINCNQVIISDNSDYVSKRLDPAEFDPVSELQFIMSGFVSGHRTLIKNLNQVEPGTFLSLDCTGKPKRECYFQFFPPLTNKSANHQLDDELVGIISSIKERIKRVCFNKQIFVPLSGGNDSRLILWLLFEAGLTNVVCYTYGVKDNPQKALAKTIAERFGFEWHFIEYSKQNWRQALDGPAFEDYLLFCSNSTSLPHIQDYCAIMALRSKGLIKENAIFLPGHVGDAFANEFAVRDLKEPYPLPPQELHSNYQNLFESELVSFLVYRHFMFFRISKSDWSTKIFRSVIQRLRGELASFKAGREGNIWIALEWILRSRTSLWIVNSVRTYEHINAKFYMPLADYDLINFLRNLPLDQIIDRQLYTRVLKKVFDDHQYEASRLLQGLPVISGGTRHTGFKRKVIRTLQKLRIYHLIERFRHSYRPERNLNFEHWFTDGERSENVTFRQILERRGVIPYLSLTGQQLVRRFLKKPSYMIHCNGILSLIFLKVFKKHYEKG